jgi:3-methylcrotonyl-CoA carboxylase beta subunit
VAKIISKINTRSQEFVDNANAMQTQVNDLQEKLSQVT